MDYKKLGFKAGIEIHQQLDGNKLFCDCPCIVHDKNPDVFFERKLRAIAGELGKIDKAAQVEMKKDRIFKYQACKSSSCLVEYDEEPPHEVNKKSLDAALEIALLLKMKVVDEVEFMRKTIVDGSNVSGFQRTALVGMDGYVDTSKGRVGIIGLFLEEEAAKKIKEEKHCVTYRLDRLGVPLLEIATAPDIKDADHAKEVASILGMMLRSTGKVKRGIGTIRQDVNISIKGHPRVEVKGFQDLRLMPKVVENEVKRQIKEKKGESHVRKFNADGSTEFLRPMPKSSRMYPETDIPSILITKKKLMSIKLPELIDDIVLRLEKEYKLRVDLARELVSQKLDFSKYAKLKLDNNFIAEVLINYPKEIKKRFGLKGLKEKDFLEVFGYLIEGKIVKGNVIDILVKKIKKEKITFSKALDDKEIEKRLKELVKKNPKTPIGGLMGDAMKMFKGKVDGKKVMTILRKLVK
jgi:Glu-tRNA(Gln) amidotransferase subunit E-like FAD-binding protein